MFAFAYVIMFLTAFIMCSSVDVSIFRLVIVVSLILKHM